VEETLLNGSTLSAPKEVIMNPMFFFGVNFLSHYYINHNMFLHVSSPQLRFSRTYSEIEKRDNMEESVPSF
jgi:hypothetical protein